MNYSDYQTEIDEILQTLKRIDLKLSQTQPYLKDFIKLVKKYRTTRLPLDHYPDIKFSLDHPVGQPQIRRDLQKDFSIRVYLDFDQYIHCSDEALAEYLELYFQNYGKKLHGMAKEDLLNEVQIPQSHSTIVKIIGDRVLLQLRERDLLQAQEELLSRLDEIVFELYRLKPR